ncbi:hypothetical protein [Rhizobium sp. S163]|uniref:hypothetical protein n=1 Tax=Rhizobium sp. S163 TaxID=3055039 RepID=UPI0025A9805C|nr:hypothetical protein [Rhizobium sp. S163]MDM9645797.1 hypothetical protein [Rhizobium sp. S163]
MNSDSHLCFAAGVRQQLEKDAALRGGLKMIPGRFMVIEQAMGVARTHGKLAETFLSDFVEDQKSKGFVARALERHGVEGVSVAPPR